MARSNDIGRELSPPTQVTPSPSAEVTLEDVLRFGQFLLEDHGEEVTTSECLKRLHNLFPECDFMLRIVHPSGPPGVTVYGNPTRIRTEVASERMNLSASTITKTQTQDAIAANPCFRVTDSWDSPFSEVTSGFSIPLVYGGELYGVLDTGYASAENFSGSDRRALLIFVNQLASALCRDRLIRASQLLRDSHTQWIEHATTLILGIDRYWIIRVCNKAVCELIGAPAGEMIGTDFRNSFSSAGTNPLVQVFEDAMSSKQETRGETLVVAAGGRHAPVAWTVAPIQNGGHVEAWVAVGQDQSDLSDLQRQLVQAEKMSTLGQITAGVIHELNNPLTAISVYSQFLLRRAVKRKGEDAQDEVEKLTAIHDGAEKIRHFTRDVMQYARPSAGKPQRLSVNKVINQSLIFCDHLFGEDGIVLQRSLDPTIPDVRAVPGQLEQVVINLITNAVHACRETGVVQVRSYLDDSGVVIAIRDEGPGISAEDQMRIFEPFFTTKRDGEGTGLGLCIVRNILEENSGELIVNSSLGVGSEFRCVLPLFFQ